MLNFRAATVHIPKPPPNRTAKAVAQRREVNRQNEAKVSWMKKYSKTCFVRPQTIILNCSGCGPLSTNICKMNNIEDKYIAISDG